MAQKKQDVKVSIIIPVYQVSNYVEQCLKSVIGQTFTDFECIIVNDATRDDSIEKCERLIEGYDGPIRFRIIHHEVTRGLSAARNTGTAVAKGEYVLYVDSDDIITNDCVEKLMAPVLRDQSIEIVSGAGRRFSDSYSLPPARPKKLDNEDNNSLEAVRSSFFERNRMGRAAWNKLIRKDFLNRYSLSFKEGIIYEDTLWSFYVMKHLSHAYLLKDVTYLYNKRPHSISTGTEALKGWHHWGVVYHEISKNLTPDDSNREVRYYTKEFCRQYIHCVHDELYRETAKNFRRELSLIKNPSNYLLLIFTDIMARSWIGRSCFSTILKLYRKIHRL
jgi:glycosyltransferase involved in cell wall biosynthesis